MFWFYLVGIRRGGELSLPSHFVSRLLGASVAIAAFVFFACVLRSVFLDAHPALLGHIQISGGHTAAFGRPTTELLDDWFIVDA